MVANGAVVLYSVYISNQMLRLYLEGNWKFVIGN